MAEVRRDRFDGHILGVGSASGRRFVIGCWHTSPFGVFADVMVAHPDGGRELLAPDGDVAEYVAATYEFDRVTITDVEVRHEGRHWHVDAGPWQGDIEVGSRCLLGVPLVAVRGALIHPVVARVINIPARVLVPGVRTYGEAAPGRREYYLPQGMRVVTGLRGTWNGEDTGPLADVHPVPMFGFSSTPRTPSLTTMTTFVDVDGGPPLPTRAG